MGSPLGGGGSIAGCICFLDEGLALVGEWVSYDDAARRIVEHAHAKGQIPPGFGHRFHTRDPRAARLLQMALELDLEGRYLQLIRSVERVLAERRSASGEPPLPVNIDGAIGAVCGDLGLNPESASVLFMVSCLPGIVAHAIEEQQRQPTMRQIDPSIMPMTGRANAACLTREGEAELNGGRCWTRTSDPRRVKAMLYH